MDPTTPAWKPIPAGSALSRYCIAALTIAIAAGLRWLLGPALGSDVPFALLIPPIVISALYGGVGPGLLATGLGTLLGAILFVGSPRGLAIGPYEAFQLLLFVLVGLLTTWVSAAYRRADRLVREQGEQSRVTLASIGDAVIVTDARERVTFLNGAAEAITGWTERDAAGRPLAEVFRIINEQSRAPVESPVTRVLREGRVVGLANHTLLVARDGTERPIDDSGAPVRDVYGAILGAVLVFRDITERRQAERALEERARQLALAADVGRALTGDSGLRQRLQLCAEAIVSSLDAAFARIWTLDEADNVLVLQASAGLYTHLDGSHSRVPVGELKIGQIAAERRPHLTNQVLGDPRVNDQEWARREGMVAFAGYPLVLEERLVGVMALFARHPLEEGALTTLSSVADELALGIEQARSRQELVESLANERVARAQAEEARRQITTILESITDAFTSVDREWRFTYVNAVAEKMCRQPRAELIGRNCWEVFPDAASMESYDIVRQSMADGVARQYESYYPPLDLWIEARVYPSPDGLTFYSRDVTERKRLEAELRRRAEELEEADRRKTEFLAVLGHELRNPLAPMLNTLELLRLEASGLPGVERRRSIIERHARHMVRLVDDLLDVSRISRGRIELRVTRVDLVDAVEQAVQMCRSTVDDRGHTLTVSLPEEPLWLAADSARLVQIVGNLLSNAARYTDRGGRIRVTVSQEDDMGVVRVRDNGRGIPAEQLGRIFELFVQVGESDETGLGIGLALVRDLVRLHGGSVEARSEGPGHGSEFEVRLPLAGAAGAELPGAPAVRAELPSAGRRVLIVDDNQDAAITLAEILSLWGHAVRVVHDGEEALRAAQETPPDLVLLDIGLPGLDGYEVARRLRSREALRNTPLVALTGYGQDGDRSRAREAGFDHHLTKPVDLDALRELFGG